MTPPATVAAQLAHIAKLVAAASASRRAFLLAPYAEHVRHGGDPGEQRRHLWKTVECKAAQYKGKEKRA